MKKNKLYYVPGMISLFLLPILCIWFLKKNYYEERCIVFAVPVKYALTKVDSLFTISAILKGKRIDTCFELNGNENDDKNTLNKINTKLLDIVEKEDTIGLRINIKESAKWSSIISLIDICQQDSFIGRFTLNDNDFFYFHFKMNGEEKQERERWYNELRKKETEHYYFEDNKPKESFIDKIKVFFHYKDIIKMQYFFIMFAFFFILSLIYTRNKFKNQK